MKTLPLLLTTLFLLTLSVDAAEEQTFFAFGDHSIPWTLNLKTTLIQADKHPDNPVLRRRPKGASDNDHALLCGTFNKDKDKFRMCYLGSFDAKQLKTPAAAKLKFTQSI